LAFGFAFISGFHDGGNVIATVISSRSITPAKAIALATISEFCGALFLGTAVAQTVASSIIQPEYLEALPPKDVYFVIISSVSGAMIWKIMTWFLGLPSSGSHALIGGLLGSGFIAVGSAGLTYDKVLKSVILPMLFTPLIGSIIGYTFFMLIRIFLSNSHRSISHFFAFAQNPTLFFLAASHASNDAQKSMGIIAMTMAVGAHEFHGQLPIPQWSILGCAVAIALGISTGGMKIVKTVGYGIYRLEPVHSFCSQLTASSVILTASIFGGPVSTTQIVASSIMGVGAASRFSGVRWPMAANIAYAWFLTLPTSVLIAAFCYYMLDKYF